MIKAIHAYNLKSLGETVAQEDNETALGDTVASGEDMEQTVINDITSSGVTEELWSIVDNLEQQQSSVIKDHYIYNLILREVGIKNNVTAERARQMQAKGLRALRNKAAIRELGRQYDLIYSRGISSIGATAFKRTWTSSTERTALELLEI